MPIDILKTYAAHGAMRSGVDGAYIGCISRKIMFYIWRHKYFPQMTQLNKESFRIIGKILYDIDYLITLSYFFSTSPIFTVKK